MAVLNEANRAALHSEFMSALSSIRESTGSLTKADIRAAIDAIDDYLEANAATMNAALPQPARGGLTTAQKARLLAYVALRRWGG